MKLNRRAFLALATLGLSGVSRAKPAQPTDHFVPLDKKLRPEWVKTLTVKGERKAFRGDELKTMGMPCGGIAAGQLYVQGDGSLGLTFGPPQPLEQGFLLRVGATNTEVSEVGFDDISFIGEYPVATVLYSRKKLPALPVTVQSQVFSPFIPLSTKDSALPATLLRFTIKNISNVAQPVALVGYLQNPIFQPLKESIQATSRNRIVHTGGVSALVQDAIEAGEVRQHPLFGNVVLAALAPNAGASAVLNDINIPNSTSPLKTPLVGAVQQDAILQPGEEKTFTFVLTWFFPNQQQPGTSGTRVGQKYATWFSSALEVAEYVGKNQKRLIEDTLLWRDTLYDTSLPYWLIQRCSMPLANLATATYQWWENGQLWCNEDVGGSDTPALASLFPELARSVQAVPSGSILKTYHSHLYSPDSGFLKARWPELKKALEALVAQDSSLLEGSLALATLRAGAVVAHLQGETALADSCEKLAKASSDATIKRLFNGEYFVPNIDSTACRSDQLVGQWLAHTLNLGYLYPEANMKKAVASIYRYSWAPDVGPQTRVHRPARALAKPGEAGLFTCTWPKSKHPEPGSEIWSGIEYQVAAQLLREGYSTPALAILRGIHERYDGVKRNPFNEIEGGDHAARALASWSVVLAASGFLYDGPAGRIGFAPKLTPESFQSVFTAAEGWGSYSQVGSERSIALKWGRLRLTELVCEDAKAMRAELSLAGKPLTATLTRDGKRITLKLASEVTLTAGQTLTVRLLE